MNKIILKLVLASLIYSQPCVSQLSQIVIQSIHSHGEAVTTPAIKFIFPGTKPAAIFHNHTHHLIHNDVGTYLFTNGTGHLYQLSSKDSLHFIKIDSTIFWGYNNGCFPFTYQNNIYNLGGSGLWRVNGQLRKFNFKSHEWEIIPLNTEIPVSVNYKEGLIYYNHENGEIYSGYYIPANSAVANADNYIPVLECNRLNLKSLTWEYLGDFKNSLVQDLKNIISIAHTPEGLLVSANMNFYLLNFNENSVFSLSDQHQTLQQFLKGMDSSFVYYRNGYIFKSDAQTIDSVTFNKDQWKRIGSLYAKPFSYFLKEWKLYWISILLLLITLAYYFFLKNYKKTVIKNYEYKKQLEKEDSKNQLPHFSESEEMLIALIEKNSMLDKKTTIEEINQCLGLQNRSIAIQKAQRHKNISSINKKFAEIHKKQLIINEKLPMDKRSLLYFIDSENLDILKKSRMNGTT